MDKLSSLYDQSRTYSPAEIANHIQALIAETGRICPGLREAACHAPHLSLEQFLEGAKEAGINLSSARIQFTKSRKFWSLQEKLESLPYGSPEYIELDQQLINWKW